MIEIDELACGGGRRTFVQSRVAPQQAIRTIFVDSPGRWISALLVAFACTTGCSSKQATVDPQATANFVASLHTGAPLTEKDCREFADKLTQAIRDGDSASANAMIDWNAMTATAAVGLDLSLDYQRKFAADLQPTPGSDGLMSDIVMQVRDGDSYEVLRISPPRVTLRLYGNTSGVNYHDMLLARRTDGEVSAVDLDIAAVGEPFSQTLRRILIPVAANQSAGLLARLQRKDSDLVENLETMQTITQCILDDQPQRAIDLINGLPASLRHDKMVLLFRMRAATKLEGNAEYKAAVEDFVKYHPDDASLPILLFEYFVAKREYDQALKQVDLIDKSVGGDPFLIVTRARIQLADDNLAEARKLTEKAIRTLPDWDDPYWLRVQCGLKEKKFAEVLASLKELKSKFNVEFVDLAERPEYGEFVKSPQYQQWLEVEKGK
jgi:hypothetical protein